MHRTILAFSLTALVGTAGCRRPVPDSSTSWHVEAGHRWRPLTVPGSQRAGFTSLGQRQTGITFENFVSDTAVLANQVLAQGGGVAIGDIDGDGRPEVFLAKTEGQSALYRNLGGMRFEDITRAAGIDTRGQATTGAVFADVDGDGDLDLLLNALGGPNRLLLNDGHGRFTEDLSFRGRNSRAGSTTATLADIDGDGDLDLYVANDKAYNAQDRFTPQERAFDQVVHQTGPRAFEVGARYQHDYKIELRDDLEGVVLLQRAEADSLYLNDGHGHFTPAPIARSPRFVDDSGRQFDEPPDNFTLAARFYDVNGDGAPDLYVANDFEDPDQLWLNDGHGNFRLAGRLAQRTTSNAAMALDFGDIDRDGNVDLFEVDMLSRDPRALKTQIPTHTALPKRPGVFTDRPQVQRNTLFLGRGDGTFAQIAELAGVDASGWSWSTLLLDVDLDGYEDILIGTGNRWDFMDADTQEKLRNRLSGLDWRQQRMTYPKLLVPNYAFRNRGDLTFEDVSDAWHFSAGPDISHGMATGDLDGDGDLDVVINRLGAPALVLRNEATRPRIAVRLKGTAPNTQGIGAKVRIVGGPVPVQEREMTAGGLYLSHAENLLVFATGAADSLRLEVRWRSGRVSVVPGARPNREYEVDEAGAEAGPATRAEVEPAAAPLFAPAGLEHRHVETRFDDWARQLLLPNAYSQLGPGVSWVDLDHDGREDLVIATGKTGRLGRFRNTERGLVPWPLPVALPPAAGDETTILPVPDGRGGTVLLIGQSNYEADSIGAAVTLPSVLSLPLDSRGRPSGPLGVAVPGDTASVGPLALADVDGDGDLDLFVGGRLLPGAYPYSPSSRLYRNDGQGHFTLDAATSALFQHFGMVTAALFSDVNGDGQPDLLVATEWGPLKLFLNDHGHFTQAGASWGLATYYSRWFGLATGDFDGDGRLDLISTSWGDNTRPRVDSLHPLYVYFGDFSPPGQHTGGLDLLLAQEDPRLHGLAPLTSFARLSRAVPAIAQRLQTFHAYADATIETVLGPAAPTALRLGINTQAQLLWLNRGDHFEPHPLPRTAQFAPAIAPVVGDFDGDGLEDLVLSQNFFPTDLTTPRYDAGRALLLRGDGHGGFTAVPGQRSGLLVYGDQRGAAAADYDQDGRLDLVITQNGAATRLFHNERATPALRVVLQGPPGNPAAIGAQLRLQGASGPWGPVREIQAGAGYWSMNGPTQLLGPRAGAARLQIRWPDGRRQEVPVPPGTATLRVSY